MIRVGVTGGIGSGKSIVCQVFYLLEVPVFHADAEARKLTNSSTEIRIGLSALFGTTIFNGAELDRNRMAELIFNDKSLLSQVNGIIHPVVERQFENWCGQHTLNAFVIHESAILFESGACSKFDKIIAITAPEDIRISRVILRNNMTHTKARAIINNQLPEEELIRRSDFTIVNDDRQPVIPQVLRLYNILLSI
jgi:dephospho-CoA kinase